MSILSPILPGLQSFPYLLHLSSQCCAVLVRVMVHLWRIPCQCSCSSHLIPLHPTSSVPSHILKPGHSISSHPIHPHCSGANHSCHGRLYFHSFDSMPGLLQLFMLELLCFLGRSSPSFQPFVANSPLQLWRTLRRHLLRALRDPHRARSCRLPLHPRCCAP